MTTAVIKEINGIEYLEYSLRLKYTNINGIPIKEIANSLLSLEEHVKFLPNLLNKTFSYKGIKDIKIEKAQVVLTKLESGSLIEDVLVRLFFKNKKNLYKNLDYVSDKYKLNIMAEKFIVPILFGGLVLFAIDSCSNSNKTPIDNSKTINIDMSNNSGIITEGTKAYGITSELYSKILEETLTSIPKRRKNKLENASLDILRPIQNNKGNLEFDGANENLTIKGVDVNNLPDKIEEEKPEEDSIVLKNTEVKIRALDRDNANSGWIAIVPAFSNSRIKLLIDKSINLEKLASNDIVNADVLVLFTRPKPSTQKPKEYTIIKIY